MIVVVFEVYEMETCKGVIIVHLNTETKVKLLQVRKKEVHLWGTVILPLSE